MNERIEELLEHFTGNNPAPAKDLAYLQAHFIAFGKELPADLREVLEASDGAEGFVNRNYLMLWGPAEIVACHKAYDVDVYAPGLLLFGSNGGGEAYAYDTRPASTMPVVKVPFVGMSLEYADVLAPTFTRFLELLAK